MNRILPPTYFFCAIVLAVLLHFLLPVHQFFAFPWRLLGLVPLLIGVLLNVLADRTFKKYGTTVKPFEDSNALVTAGVFNVTRNPMYLGMVLILLGAASLLGSVTPFAAFIFLGVLLDYMFISPEEQMLEDIFGDQFRQYRKRVRRWI
ncbi:MAG: isoprenylcysteine carboxylmethyltransferase family protein [Chloroflexi bacterium]|nr:isoprenylcysteine carboxylmethyltransferase family protein [Chloroflexota bacterium]